MSEDHDPLLDRLANLPEIKVDPHRAEAQRLRTRRLFVDQAEGLPLFASLARIYAERLEPVVVAGAAALYLGWAFRAVVALHP